jgi:xylulokinase
LEGVACAIANAVDALPVLGHGTPIRLGGGGSMQPAWRQLLADILDRPLVSVDVELPSARGAAILAGVGTGVWTTIASAPAPALTAEKMTHPRQDLGAAATTLLDRYRAAWSMAAGA